MGGKERRDANGEQDSTASRWGGSSSLPFVTACLRLFGLEGSLVVWCSILCLPTNVVTCLILLFNLKI